MQSEPHGVSLHLSFSHQGSTVCAHAYTHTHTHTHTTPSWYLESWRISCGERKPTHLVTEVSSERKGNRAVGDSNNTINDRDLHNKID